MFLFCTDNILAGRHMQGQGEQYEGEVGEQAELFPVDYI